MAVKGTLWIDNGALAAVLDRRKSLFAAGITKVGLCTSVLIHSWAFKRQVQCQMKQSRE